jgi:hypothetical protein
MLKPRTFIETPIKLRSGLAVEGHGFKPCHSRPPEMRLSGAAGLWRISLLALTLLFCVMPSLRAQTPDLPPGPAQAKVRTACTECHEASIIVQQRLNKAAWTKEVDKMIKWGALVEPTDRDSFIDYLGTNFPEDKPPAEMPRTVSTKKR